MDFLQEIYHIYELILSPIDKMQKRVAVNKLKEEFDIEGSICNKYFSILSNNKASGVIYTPIEIVEYIIKNTIDKEAIIKNPWVKILDPSCGTGNFLIPLFFYLKNILEENNVFHIENIEKHIVEKIIYGYDIDGDALKVLTIEMFHSTGQIMGKNLYIKDFLFNEIQSEYDFIIGNPPYVGHKTIDREYSKALKQTYKEIYKYKGDVSYCFFEQSINSLKEAGKLSFITSRYFLESPSGIGLRKFLKENVVISKIVDFYGIRPFKNVGIDPLIIFMERAINIDFELEVIKPKFNKEKVKKGFYESLFLNKGKEYRSFLVKSSRLQLEGWSLISKEESEIIEKIKHKAKHNLSDLCDSYQGIITGCDKAFIVDEKMINENNIERGLLEPWIKSTHITKDGVKDSSSFLIYSNRIKEETIHPNAIKFIKSHKEKLESRRECIKGYRKWYELQWGREQKVFQGEKIVFPYKSSDNRFAVDSGSYYSADVYSLILKDEGIINYKELSYILNSKLYEFYFKSFGKKLGENQYEYYPSYVMKLKIPVGENIKTEEELYNFFEITDEEKEIIEK